MNVLSSLLNWIGSTIGADPNTLSTTSKTLVGAINEVASKDYIVEQGTTNGWVWCKWNSGRYEASRAHSIGTYTIETSIGSGVMCGGAVTIPNLPHTLTEGVVQATFGGSTTNAGSWVEKTTTNNYRICKVTSTTVTLNNTNVLYIVVGGKWK